MTTEALHDSTVSEDFNHLLFQSDSSTPLMDAIRWPAKWRDAKIEEIQRLRELPSNWDSYGAHPADPRSIYHAIARLHTLATETTEEPRVACLPSGNVVLAWESNDDSQACEIEFLPNGLIAVMFADDNDPSANVEGTFHVFYPPPLSRLIEPEILTDSSV